MRTALQAEWRQIPDYKFYEVSTNGEVRYRGRLVKGSLNQRGYRVVTLRRRPKKVHQLVMLAFVGPRPEGLEIRHLNDNKADNRLDNLLYGTKSENQTDRVRNGIHPQSIKTHCLRGHEFTEANTKRVKRGDRIRRACRTCANAASIKFRRGQNASA